MITNAQIKDANLNKEIEKTQEKFIRRDGIIREKTPRCEKIRVPDSIIWNLIIKILVYLQHFGTNRVPDFRIE